MINFVFTVFVLVFCLIYVFKVRRINKDIGHLITTLDYQKKINTQTLSTLKDFQKSIKNIERSIGDINSTILELQE